MKTIRYLLILTSLLSLLLLLTSCLEANCKTLPKEQVTTDEEKSVPFDPEANLPHTTQEVKIPPKSSRDFFKDFTPFWKKR